MFLICVLLVGSLSYSMGLDKPFYDLQKAEQLFEEFITTHGKNYQDNEEKQKRFDIFKDNLKKINYLNTASEAAFGVNQFSDLTADEFVSRRTGLVLSGDDYESACKVVTDEDVNSKDAPDLLDFRQMNAVTPIKNQDICSSCWIFSSIGSIESQYALKHGQLLSLSEQQLMDCLECSEHCDEGGSMVEAMSELIGLPGVELESDYPYVSRDLTCQFDKTKVRVKVTGCVNYQMQDENKLKEALYKNGPIAIGINGDGIQHYHGDILNATHCDTQPISHGVLLVGYGTDRGRDYWLIKNSWGSTLFGEQGYLRISRGHNTCGLMNNAAVSAVVA